MKPRKILLFLVILLSLIVAASGCSKPAEERIEDPTKEMRRVPDDAQECQDDILKDQVPAGCVLELPDEFCYPTDMDTAQDLSYVFSVTRQTVYSIIVETQSGEMNLQIIDVSVGEAVYEISSSNDKSGSVELEAGTYLLVLNFTNHKGSVRICLFSEME